MYSIININNSKICRHISPSIWTSEYYDYCIRLLDIVLRNIDKPINVILGDIPCDFGDYGSTVKLDIQSEHTLVKLGGRSVDEIIYGDINLLDGDGKYLIRVPNYKYYSQLDGTIEYSMPNIVNLSTNPLFADYLSKAIYIAPTIYDTPDFQQKEKVDTITLISSNHSDRRSRFFQDMQTKKLEVTNVQNVFDRYSLKRLYDRSRIMVNLHQTDHHHTFEELRVLPALFNGTIIVAEDVPLKHTIPYADSIVWSSYNDLAETVRDVQNNYEWYFKRIFTLDLEWQLIQLHENNIQNLVNHLTNL
jgi:hypothetical protein